jgi:gamma-glutamylcyclotransferase (GGCT)/AIG2-like uncharacterized protein YtfP
LSESAKLNGYRLVFQQPGIPLIEPVFATIERSDKDVVYGVLHEIPQEHANDIDRFEGPAYERFEAVVEGTRTGKVTAWAYRTRKPVVGLRPSRRYLKLLIEGAREFNLPENYIARIENEKYSVEIPMVSSIMPMVVKAAEHAARRNVIAQRVVYGFLKLMNALR